MQVMAAAASESGRAAARDAAHAVAPAGRRPEGRGPLHYPAGAGHQLGGQAGPSPGLLTVTRSLSTGSLTRSGLDTATCGCASAAAAACRQGPGRVSESLGRWLLGQKHATMPVPRERGWERESANGDWSWWE